MILSNTIVTGLYFNIIHIFFNLLLFLIKISQKNKLPHTFSLTLKVQDSVATFKIVIGIDVIILMCTFLCKKQLYKHQELTLLCLMITLVFNSFDWVEMSRILRWHHLTLFWMLFSLLQKTNSKRSILIQNSIYTSIFFR